jgi:hypothetical protein
MGIFSKYNTEPLGSQISGKDNYQLFKKYPASLSSGASVIHILRKTEVIWSQLLTRGPLSPLSPFIPRVGKSKKKKENKKVHKRMLKILSDY